MDKKSLRIVYMGTPEFAVAPLKRLVENGYNVVGCITMPDKAVGRGHKIQSSPVKDFAVAHNIPLLQPEKLKNEEFLESLKAWQADLQIVVAFRMLPKVVWDMPKFGTFNLHAALLPQYRGAAPLNWAVINGEKETGVTTFFLTEEIDTGKIALQEKITIADSDNVGTVHDKLMLIGADLVLKTVDLLIEGKLETREQKEFYTDEAELKSAPKIFKETCKIDWSKTPIAIHNLVRGLSPYPAAWSIMTDGNGTEYNVKIFDTQAINDTHTLPFGTIRADKKTLDVAVESGFIRILSLQMPGKKKITAEEFLRGFKNIEQFKFS